MNIEEHESFINIDAEVEKSKNIYTVSELTKNIRFLLEDTFASVWVEGEISNFRIPTSGHMYFTLKDEASQLNCVVFKNTNNQFKFTPADGLAVLCFGRISVYERGGQYQLVIERMEPKGVGALQLAFEQLKQRLGKEGLFDPRRKKPLPFLPGRIGVVTSPTGAVIRDILNIANRRFGNIEIIISPVKVQGPGAAEEIAKAIKDFNEFGDVDVLIVGRGGGSIEDLWPFNEEIVARAIFDSKIPVVSGVGHETDWTIADFVADMRAPTPSAAAELVIPKKEDMLSTIEDLRERLRNGLVGKVNLLKEKLASLAGSYVLREPLELVRQLGQRIDELTKNLFVRVNHILVLNQERFRHDTARLEGLSPLAILKRGYSITTRFASDEVIKDSSGLEKGEKVRTRLGQGEFVSRVEEIK